MIAARFFAIMLAVWVAKSSPGRQVQPQKQIPSRSDSQMQISVIAQVAATPGKQVHATQNGVESLSYTFKSDDAAIALFTLRDKRTGKNGIPYLMEARDPQGHLYRAVIETFGDVNVNLVAVKRGFSVRPSSVAITISSGGLPEDRRFVINVKNIDAPRRVLSPPTPSLAISSKKVAEVDVDDVGGNIRIRTVESPPKGGYFKTSFVALSYFDVPESGFWPFEPSLYCKALDAAKIRIDRMKPVLSETTLVYSNAQVIQANGKNFLSLPKLQRVGTVAGYTVSLGNRIPYKREVPLNKRGKNDQEVDLRFSEAEPIVKGSVKAFDPRQGRHGGQPIDASLIEILDVSPSVEAMGLDSLRLQVAGGNVDVLDGSNHGRVGRINMTGIPTNSFKTIYARRRASGSTISAIPELKIHLRATKFILESTRTLVVPVHHISQKSANPRTRNLSN